MQFLKRVECYDMRGIPVLHPRTGAVGVRLGLKGPSGSRMPQGVFRVARAVAFAARRGGKRDTHEALRAPHHLTSIRILSLPLQGYTTYKRRRTVRWLGSRIWRAADIVETRVMSGSATGLRLYSNVPTGGVLHVR